MDKIQQSREPVDFSLVQGGPLFQLLLSLGLITPTHGLLRKRIIAITLFAWLPLLLFSLFDGKAWANAGIPFLRDMGAQTRFLIALPLLIIAELLVHTRLSIIVGQFLDRDIVTRETLPRFKKLIASAMRIRNSLPIELFLLFLTFVAGHWILNTASILETIPSPMDSWYATSSSTGKQLTPAGYWYVFVSRPLFQFILFRWYFRLLIWTRFLFQTSRLDLNLIPTHPDYACGIGFLASSIIAFTPLIVAHGALLAGLIGNAIFFTGSRLSDFIPLILGVVVILQLVILGPLAVFSRKLLRAKLNGLQDYGALASVYTIAFDRKWLQSTQAESLLGSSDIQSLADIGNSFQVIRNIQTFPFSTKTAILLLIYTLIPVLPLLLTMIPLEELIKKLISLIL